MDSFIFEQNESSDFDSSLFEDVFLSSEEPGVSSYTRSSKGADFSDLKNKDYNLNSPLIADAVENLISDLRKKQIGNTYTSTNEYKTAHKEFLKQKVDWGRMNTTRDFHTWMSSRVLTSKDLEKVTAWEKLKKFLQENWNQTEIAISFWKSLGLDMNSQMSRYSERKLKKQMGSNKESYIGRMFNIYWAFHRLILLMNSSSTEERSHLLDHDPLFFLSVSSGEDADSFIGECCVLDFKSSVIVTPGFCLIPDQFRILDRNMVLMIKDLALSRFNTLFGLLGKEDETLSPDFSSSLIKLYEAGDSLIAATGETAYNVIKMLEPWCNQQFVELSSKSRPLIPPFDKFSNHVVRTITKWDEENCQNSLNTFFGLIKNKEPRELGLIFGTYRHWGHPFIDYEAGLEKLYQQVTMPKQIDKTYTKLLASDLARKLISSEFKKTKTWAVDINQMEPSHPFYEHIRNRTWPTMSQILDFGDVWDELPITKMFELPVALDLSEFIDDKSHSITRSELSSHLARKPNTPIPTKKVLNTCLEEPDFSPAEFLTKVNDHGLPENDLILGLKGKEREIKPFGRYFCLMSYEVRKYFVLTELLIKKHILPLFDSITMADDVNKMLKKILSRTEGQGLNDYTKISIANHLDYEKWNNHQRYESTEGVFRIMGKAFGLENLFLYTHRIFQNSWVYYNDRGDQITIQDGTITPKGSLRSCWNGQDGGLEGLRQKGWCVNNLLMIEREATTRNTKVQTLAQGDNQVITCTYSLPKLISETTLQEELRNIISNNEAIMAGVEEGAKKIGLLINQDETIQSADYFVYGKIPIFRGNLIPVESKKWSRMGCLSNDQIPSMASVLSSVGTNSLTIAQHSSSLMEPILDQVLFSEICIHMIEYHNPILSRSPQFLTNLSPSQKFRRLMRLIFLDPTLGGICGMSLTRFLIRQFPDPLTESLVFWKKVAETTENKWIKAEAIQAGHPITERVSLEALSLLLERPTSLNLPRGLSPGTLIKNEIRSALQKNVNKIKNVSIRNMVSYLSNNETKMLSFLKTVRPFFPRFLSEFYQGSFMGIVESIVGLFQNSRTIRNQFSRRFGKELSRKFRESEEASYRHLKTERSLEETLIWNCSSSHADLLRSRSWGIEVVGTTVPHPLEMMGRLSQGTSLCRECPEEPYPFNYTAVMFTSKLTPDFYTRGVMSCYLGSATSTSTSVMNPWEKITKIPILKRAFSLRDSINWFIEPDSNLAQSILSNIKSLVGDIALDVPDFKRTGSALHRFHSSRSSGGGFAATNFNLLSYCYVTSDQMKAFSKDLRNWDFLYQACLLFCQQVAIEVNLEQQGTSSQHHFHISCKECLREIPEIRLESAFIYCPEDMSAYIQASNPHISQWTDSTPKIHLREGDFQKLDLYSQSYHVGVAQGAIFSVSKEMNYGNPYENSLFPVSVYRKVLPRPYLAGLLKGLMVGGSITCLTRRKLHELMKPQEILMGSILYLIDSVARHPGLYTMLSTENFTRELATLPHKTPASYPSSPADTLLLLSSYLRNHLFTSWRDELYHSLEKELWLFSDELEGKLTGLILIGHHACLLLRKEKLKELHKRSLRGLLNSIPYFAENLIEEPVKSKQTDKNLSEFMKLTLMKGVQYTKSEVRHAVRSNEPLVIQELESCSEQINWGREASGWVKTCVVEFQNSPVDRKDLPSLSTVTNPLISGLRPVQLATGAHYKIRSILNGLNIKVTDFISCGDGSGGGTAAILRMFPSSRGIFNSLIPSDIPTYLGSHPGPPSIIAAMDSTYSNRCVNWKTAWEQPSDLRDESTWEVFKHLKDIHHLSVTLILCDAEVQEIEDASLIGTLLRVYLHDLLEPDGTIVFKVYSSLLSYESYDPINILGPLFQDVRCVTTQFTSSHSSEVYLVCTKLLSSETIGIYATLTSLADIINLSAAFQSKSDEFKRALSIKRRIMIQGVPREFLPTWKDALVSLLIGGSCPSGTSYTIVTVIETLIRKQKSSLSIVLGLLSLLINFTLNTTRWNDKMAHLPSLESTTRSLFIWAGFCFWISFKTKNEKIYVFLHQLINEEFMLYYESVSVGYKKNTFQPERSMSNTNTSLYSSRKHHLRWSLTQTLFKHRTILKLSKSTLSSSWIRMLEQLFGNHALGIETSREFQKNLDSFLRPFNKKLCYRHLLQNTGSLTILPLIYRELWITSPDSLTDESVLDIPIVDQSHAGLVLEGLLLEDPLPSSTRSWEYNE